MNIQSVTFYNQEIQVLNHEGKPYVAMRSIVENIGLDWASQYRRINNNEVLSASVVMMTTKQKSGVKRELLCLPLGMLNGWLFGIEIKRCKPEIRDVLRLYQTECFDVLYKHFMPTHEKHYPTVKESNKVPTDSRRWFVEVRVTDNLFKGTVSFSGVAHDTNAVITHLADHFGYQIMSMNKVRDALENLK